MLKIVVLAGGSGTRLWPLSRSAYPKQFISLYDDQTMIQSTVDRVRPLDFDSLTVVCNAQHRFLVAEQLRAMDQTASIILEPVGRDTAPAIALAALEAVAVGKDPLLLVLPADHVIKKNNIFADTINASVPLAESGKLVTYGIKPDFPSTDYGYIKLDSQCGVGYNVEKFIEKPSPDRAGAFFESGDYLWNSGMFLFKASGYLQALEKYRPDMYKSCVAAFKLAAPDLDFLRISEQEFGRCVAESVDYAIMEHTKDAVTVPLSAGWSDVGTWYSLWKASDKDLSGNVTRGDVVLQSVKNSHVIADDKLVAVLGVEDLVVVNSADALLVAHKRSLHELKHLVKHLEEENRDEVKVHRKVFRPWGYYEQVDSGSGYQVKRITVLSGAKLSLQKHKYRAEHWVIVRGTAVVTRGDETFELHENESTFIPKNIVHSLENAEKDDLQLIEVQSGDYLGEDDIVRLNDIYGRR
ncbi:MAG: mannose-1-phosphate guanylyltransferase/mannose-6-phosphate isomerase [Porticoccaceae bacterium]|nr:mannose-1-phosphate guanylyltransferase/mannose-6-phosphate isomerase [Porticoccaceae bacterium]MDG1474697.1 mannose-1-phosphate guanylyltransferase/mannose-6-phosphate isomerase [Porticoccaceae bacterium]